VKLSFSEAPEFFNAIKNHLMKKTTSRLSRG